MQTPDINKGEGYVGLNEALEMVIANTNPRNTVSLPLASCVGYVAAQHVKATVNSPTDDMSLKDGFALKAQDVASASFQSPVRLEIAGSVFAGGRFKGSLHSGQAVKICTGSPVPEGADAVVVTELCDEISDEVLVKDSIKAGNNIFGAGEDVKAGSVVVDKGAVLLPARLGFAAAGGVSKLSVYSKPKVALIAIGDEVVIPGTELKEGQLYSSNLINLGAWLSCFDLPSSSQIAKDDPEAIKSTLLSAFKGADVIVTCGGAWVSERDIVVSVLDGLGWKKVFRYVRMGPGKGITFGVWQGKSVFCLPGSPPSNDMAFVQLSLPGILHLCGITGSPFFLVRAKLTQGVKSRSRTWAEFTKGKLISNRNGEYLVTPYADGSRLRLISDADCLICKPENDDDLSTGEAITVQVMLPAFGGLSISDTK